MFTGITILTFIVLQVTHLCTGYNKFEYTACRWKNSKCEPFDREQAIDDKNISKKSRWPKGPYALLSPIEGCPESPDIGWRRGYISFTWKQPHVAVTERGCGFYTSSVKCKQALLPEQWPYIESYMSGPFSKNFFRLNFCVKNDKVYVGSDDAQWPNGSYSIFKDSYECPSGFQNSNLTIRLPPIYFWKSYGKLPDFEILSSDKEEHVILVLKTCIHEENQGGSDFTEDDNELKLDSFVLVETNISKCPPITYKEMAVENLKLFKDIADDDEEEDEVELFTFCLYRPISVEGQRYGCDDLHHTTGGFYNNEEDTYCEYFEVTDRTIVRGNATFYSQELLKAGLYTIEGPRIIVPWILVDLGRNLIVTGIQIKKFYRRFGRYVSAFSRCFIGDDRWAITHYDADLCLFDDLRSPSYIDDLVNLFRKHYNGRFIKLAVDSVKPTEVLNFIMSFLGVLTSGQITYDDTICNEDLGMADGRISNYQIQDADSSRPFNSGYCRSNSTIPYLTVNLDEGIHVNGITLFNMQRVKHECVNGTIQSRLVPAGSKELLLSLSTILSNETHVQYNKTFRIDEYLPIERPQTFFFDVPGKVKFIEIYILQSLEETCLRFELLGCKGPGLDKEIFPALYREKDRLAVYNLQTMNVTSSNTSVHPSIGFHGTYPAGYSFMWIINSPDGQFISLLFVKITHNVFNEGSCSDTYRFLHYGENGRRVLDGVWKPITSVLINTAETRLTLTLSTCAPIFKIKEVNQGFNAIVRTTGIPTCFSTHDKSLSRDMFIYKCRHPMMIISPNYHLSVQDSVVPEKWEIEFPRFYIQLQFIYFNIRCDTGSSFQITDKLSKSRLYCNLRTVKPEMLSYFEYVHIRFHKGDMSKANEARYSAFEWFQAKYIALTKSIDRLIDTYKRINAFTIVEDITMGYGNAGCSFRFGKCYLIPYDRHRLLTWNAARHHCLSFGSRLVTIHSDEEHELIKSIILDYQLSYTYFVYIGLSRAGKSVHIWEDGSPVTFSAWSNKKQTLQDECTGMNADLYNTNKTWTSVNCDAVSWTTLICERDITDNSTDTTHGRCYSIVNKYTGLWNITKSNRTCQKWTSTNPHDHEPFQDSQFADGSVEDASNYCRDPNNQGFLWCFTTDHALRWEQCIFDYVYENLDTKSLFMESNETFYCGNGDYISYDKICDGIPNCDNCNDETNCTDEVHPFLRNVSYSSENISLVGRTYSMFQCRQSEEWISLLSQCDGVIDCVDASDEINCSKRPLECSSNEYKCGSGECIHISQMCDFIEDCVDASDESCDYPLCSNSEFRCKNQQCIPMENRCNAFDNCLDGSDENGCDKVTCRNSTFHCDHGRCIPRRLVCDNYPDCQDKSDELSCEQQRFSCEEWWNDGYRTSGVYKLNTTDVECNFRLVHEEGIIKTVFYNFEVTRTTDPNVEVIHSTKKTTGKGLEASFFKNDTYSCEQTIKQTCTPAFIAAFESNHSSRDAYKVCNDCAVLKVNLSRFDGKYSEAYSCNGDKPINESDIKWYFTYHQSEEHMPNVNLSSNVFNESFHLEFGPMVCNHKIVVDEKEFSCDDGHVFPVSIRCVYDTDHAGFIKGCRSGKHLQGCDNVQCPENTAKCPGSFCIPTRFICDGQVHCPGGHDEKNCGCKSNELEVILLYKEDTMEKDIFYDIGRQFFSNSSIVRSLIYRERKMPSLKQSDEQILLDIFDREIDPFFVEKMKYGCNYTILASNFVNTIKFTKSGTRGLIFFERNDSNTLSNIFTNLKTNPGFLIYRLQHNPTGDGVDSSFVRNITVGKLSTLATLGAKYFPDLCKEAAKISCPNQYKCATSKTCIPLQQVCDGFAQCKYGDDERSCSYICPENCTCLEYSTDCSNRGIEESIVESLDNKSRSIDLSRNPGLQDCLNTKKWLFPYLIVLNLSNDNIHDMKPFIFNSLLNLRILDLSFNELKQIPGYAFSGLHRLKQLSLHGNKKMIDFDSYSLTGLNGLNSLEIRNVTIGTLSVYTFYELDLDTLTFSYNSIKEIKDGAFETLKVRKLDIKKNKISGFGKKPFQGVYGLEQLHTPEFKFCCVKPDYLLENNCSPKRDEFSSCEDLIRHPALQAMLWFMGIIALLGNVLSIVYRLVYDRQQLKFGYGIFVTNLAVADFFMGVYLLIIAIADAVYKKRYIFEDASWRSSTWCNIAGFLSTISSEASVFFLCLITIDRLLVIKFPFGQVRFDSKKSCIACGLSWTISILIGIIPIIDHSHFHNRFYSKSGVCIALPLTKDGRSTGWWYSFFVFVGLNFVTFCFIACGQIAIYIEMKRSTSGINKSKYSHDKQGARRRMELTVARNLFFIVATDFLCWFPIGCMGIMSVMDNDIPGNVYAWTAVFVLPVNSALNPILYTLTAIIGKKQKKPTDLSPIYISAKKVRPFNGMFRYFMTYNSQDCFISLNELKHGTIPVTPTDAAKIALNLTRCLCVLHKNCLVVKKLKADVVYISVAHGKVIGEVQLRQEPVICNSKDEKADDIYQLALIIRMLLPRKKQITSL